jgi:hypothetical protein
MYSSVLDSLTPWDGGADRLPRVVVATSLIYYIIAIAIGFYK